MTQYVQRSHIISFASGFPKPKRAYTDNQEGRVEDETSGPRYRNTFKVFTAKISSWMMEEIRIRANKSTPIRRHIARYTVPLRRVLMFSNVKRSYSTTWLAISTARCGITGYYGWSMPDWHDRVEIMARTGK